MFCFISLWLSLIPLSPHAQPPSHPTDELTECVSCCFLWRLVQDLHPMELSSCQKSGAERAAGCLQRGSAWCQSPTSQDRRSSFLSNNTQTAFFPSSFSSLCEFTRQSDAFARSTELHIPSWTVPAQPTHLPPPRAPGRLAHACPALGAAARFAVRGFMTCYISAFSEGWVGASSFH